MVGKLGWLVDCCIALGAHLGSVSPCVDGATESSAKYDYQFATLDRIRIPGAGCMTVHELLDRKERAEQNEEWMYQIQNAGGEGNLVEQALIAGFKADPQALDLLAKVPVSATTVNVKEFLTRRTGGYVREPRPPFELFEWEPPAQIVAGMRLMGGRRNHSQSSSPQKGGRRGKKLQFDSAEQIADLADLMSVADVPRALSLWEDDLETESSPSNRERTAASAGGRAHGTPDMGPREKARATPDTPDRDRTAVSGGSGGKAFGSPDLGPREKSRNILTPEMGPQRLVQSPRSIGFRLGSERNSAQKLPIFDEDEGLRDRASSLKRLSVVNEDESRAPEVIASLPPSSAGDPDAAPGPELKATDTDNTT
eukprot:Hpha_TRINITY_DN16793_c1_g1::TRINITY_DN16793_c1_g1_i1::g.76329::m.76329